jgi:hypothetical protein
LKGGVEVDLDEIEEGFQVGIAAMFGPLLSSLGYFVQEGEDLFRTDSIQLSRVSDFAAKF